MLFKVRRKFNIFVKPNLNIMKRYFLLVFLLSFALVSCNKAKKVKKENEEEILAYIAEHNLDATATGSGLYYVIEEPGTGTKFPTISSTINMKYTGTLLDGTIFDSNQDGYQNQLYNLIEGWKEGVPFFKKGGKGILLIPSHLGYGQNQSGSIPPNSVLIFDIELLDFI